MSPNATAGHLNTGEDSADSARREEDLGGKQQSNDSSDNDEPICAQPPL
jgi:hypothetical protein